MITPRNQSDTRRVEQHLRLQDQMQSRTRSNHAIDPRPCWPPLANCLVSSHTASRPHRRPPRPGSHPALTGQATGGHRRRSHFALEEDRLNEQQVARRPARSGAALGNSGAPGARRGGIRAPVGRTLDVLDGRSPTAGAEGVGGVGGAQQPNCGAGRQQVMTGPPPPRPYKSSGPEPSEGLASRPSSHPRSFPLRNTCTARTAAAQWRSRDLRGEAYHVMAGGRVTAMYASASHIRVSLRCWSRDMSVPGVGAARPRQGSPTRP